MGGDMISNGGTSLEHFKHSVDPDSGLTSD